MGSQAGERAGGVIAREQFLATGELPSAAVPSAVLRSWRRSQQCRVDPESLRAPYEDDLVDRRSRLAEAGLPVVEHFAEELEGSPTCLVFADREARGIEVVPGERRLQPLLERFGMCRGFRFAEELVGTNGIGTVAETGQPIQIGVGEHYSRPLLNFSCAGAPVRHPFTGRLEAVVDLTAPFDDRNGLMLPFVREIARQVESRLYAQGSTAERLLLQHFMSTSKGSSKGVVVVNEEMILANALATHLLEGVPQSLLWEHAARSVADRLNAVHELPFGESRALVVRCFPVKEGARVIGAILELDHPPEPNVRRRERGRSPELPGLIGRSAAWRRVCQEARRCAASPGFRVVIAGESGVGKRSVARAMLATGLHQEAVTEFDAALEAAEEPGAWVARVRDHLHQGGSEGAVLTHVDCLSESSVRTLAAVIDELGGNTPPILATLCVGHVPVTHCAPLLDRISVPRIDVPPLRQRPDDIPDLVTGLLGRLTGGERRCSPEAIQAITRFPWPGNVRQLETALRAAILARPQGDIRVEHLPQEIRRGGVRRRLTPMEQSELDTILQALDDTHGNKVEAANQLGISRSTLYRKLRTYGLDPDQIVY